MTWYSVKTSFETKWSIFNSLLLFLCYVAYFDASPRHETLYFAKKIVVCQLFIISTVREIFRRSIYLGIHLSRRINGTLNIFERVKGTCSRYDCIADNSNKAQNIKKRNKEDHHSKGKMLCAARKMSPERILESVTPSLREIRRIRRLMRRGFRLPLLPYLAQLRPPLILPRVRALPPPRYPPWLPSLFHGIPRIDSINSFARAMRALSSPYFPSFRCPPLPFLHRRFVWQRRSRLAHPHDKRDVNVICGIYFFAGILFF